MARQEDSQSRPRHCAVTKVAKAKSSRQNINGMYVLEIMDKKWCRKEDYSALRASPFGSACGRSNWLRQFVEPAFCLSGVRIAAD
jgi:hypothetical protein